jgi:hypothetical protein
MFFCQRGGRQVGGPPHRQQRIGPHGQRAMPRPSRPMSPCILIQAHFALRLFKASFNGPPAARHLHHGGQGGRRRCNHDLCRPCGGVAQTPAHQEPLAPAWLPRRGQGEPPPVIPAWTFGAVASTQPAPPLSRPCRQDGLYRRLPASTPDICLPRDGQDLSVVVCLQPQA